MCLNLSTPLRSCGGASGLAAAIAAMFLSVASCGAVDVDEVRRQLLAGEYAEAVAAAEAAETEEPRVEDWPLLRIEGLMAIGKYPAAREAVTKGLERFQYSLRLRLAGFDVYRANGDVERAKTLKEEMDRLGGERDWAYREAADRVALGKAAILLGADPKRVLE